eukprot:TRINITY_DN985_c0_g1_i1.p2 TRINITY_DN985_c0_g1~~TRINITY_DN985_c0_g1_i1.p2  ORF type:complete len:282 (+),score=108.41 TRINITY_DN985_c0_g1_i1:187-1032(+)
MSKFVLLSVLLLAACAFAVDAPVKNQAVPQKLSFDLQRKPSSVETQPSGSIAGIRVGAAIRFGAAALNIGVPGPAPKNPAAAKAKSSLKPTFSAKPTTKSTTPRKLTAAKPSVKPTFSVKPTTKFTTPRKLNNVKPSIKPSGKPIKSVLKPLAASGKAPQAAATQAPSISPACFDGEYTEWAPACDDQHTTQYRHRIGCTEMGEARACPMQMQMGPTVTVAPPKHHTQSHGDNRHFDCVGDCGANAGAYRVRAVASTSSLDEELTFLEASEQVDEEEERSA